MIIILQVIDLLRVGSSGWLERTPDKREVGGSSPPRPTKKWGVSSAGRAPALQAGGHRFDPDTLHHFLQIIISIPIRSLRAARSF